MKVQSENLAMLIHLEMSTEVFLIDLHKKIHKKLGLPKSA